MRQFLGLLFLVGLVVKFWAWILAAIVLWLVIQGAIEAAREIKAEREQIARQHAALIARADDEHRALLDGDLVLGTHGQFPPAEVALDDRAPRRARTAGSR